MLGSKQGAHKRIIKCPASNSCWVPRPLCSDEYRGEYFVLNGYFMAVFQNFKRSRNVFTSVIPFHGTLYLLKRHFNASRVTHNCVTHSFQTFYQAFEQRKSEATQRLKTKAKAREFGWRQTLKQSLFLCK